MAEPRPERRGSCTTDGIGCFVVWAVLLTVAGLQGAELHLVLAVLGGWAIAWVSGTIARPVDPPPRRRLRPS